MRFVWFVVLAINLAVPAAQPSVQIEFFGASVNWADRSITGHAFVCLETLLANNIKEDCYGFYPRSIGTGLIGGSGVVDSEFDFNRHPPTRFAHIEASFKAPITDGQRRAIAQLINGWNRNFAITDSNCVTFANALARSAGLKVPPDATYTSPLSYVRILQALNK